MKMTQRFILSSAFSIMLINSHTLIAEPAHQAKDAAGAIKTEIQKHDLAAQHQERQQEKTTGQLITLLNQAQLAANSANQQALKEQLDAAKKVAHELNAHLDKSGQSSETQLQTMASKVALKKAKDGHSYLFPIAFNQQKNLGSEKSLAWIKSQNIEIIDAEIVKVAFKLDVKAIETALDLAAEALNNNNHNELKTQLGKLSKALQVESLDNIAMDKARQNLAFAQVLVGNQQYGHARFALSHAGQALANMDAQKLPNLSKIQAQIKSIDSQLNRQDPKTIAQVQDKLAALSNALSQAPHTGQDPNSQAL